MDNNYSRLHTLQTCPVSGLPIIHKPEWVYESEEEKYFKATLCLVGDSIIFNKTYGNATLKHIQEFLRIIDLITKEIPGNNRFYIVEEYSDYYNTCFTGKTLYINTLNANDQLKGILFCNPKPALLITIKIGKFLHKKTDKVAEIFDSYNDAIKYLAKNKEISSFKDDSTFSLNNNAEIGQRDGTNQFLELLGSIDWEKKGLPWQSISMDSPLYDVYQAMTVMKGDFDTLVDKNKRSIDIITRQNKYNKIRAKLWKLASQQNLLEYDMVKGLLVIVGKELGLSRTTFCVFDGDDISKSNLVSKIEWCADNVSETIGIKIPAIFHKYFLGLDTILLDENNISKLLPEIARPIALPVIKSIFKSHNIKSIYLSAFKLGGVIEGVMAFDICKDHDGDFKWDKERSDIIKEAVQIVENFIMQRKLKSESVDVAHKAGQAEIAASVLHNIGNTLTSIVTSNEAARDILEMSETKNLDKANALLKENLENIEDFILCNPKGKKLLHYYLKIGEAINAEHEVLLTHIKRASNKIDVVKDIVVAQQTYASHLSLSEKLNLADIIEDALIIQGSSIEKYGVNLIKKFKRTPRVLVQKSKVIHIFINLINNARDALLKNEIDKREIVIEVDHIEKKVIVRFSDNGMGIKKEKLVNIFNYGYTTKKHGHGFGLHSCANYMTEMNGLIKVESEGDGCGTVFVLEFPSEK